MEYCACPRVERLLLAYMLTDNPIHCFDCMGALDPMTLALTDEQASDVHAWLRQFRALYDLWLDSGEYESWAKTQLLRPAGQVNVNGLAVAAMLSERVPAWYWWFHDEDDPLPLNCPACQRGLGHSARHGHGQCEACRIIV